MAGLPRDRIFRETVMKSLIGEIVQLWKRSMEAERNKDLHRHSPQSQNKGASKAA